MMQWHKLSITEVLKLLNTNGQGLGTVEAREKLKKTGPNELEEGKKKNIAAMLLSQFKDVMILILLAAAIISGFIGDFTDTIVIIVIVILNAILGFYKEYRADKAMLALKKMSVTQARVLRNKQITILPATQLVPGNVVLLETGNAVPADIRLMESIHLKTEEAALTGEFPVLAFFNDGASFTPSQSWLQTARCAEGLLQSGVFAREIPEHIL